MTPVSVLVLAYNEESNIGACLDTVYGWSGDIHVVDSGSDDGTLAVTSRYTPNLHAHGYVDHASQLAWALEHVPFEHEWVLVLDADHRISPELRTAIDGALASPPADVAGFYMRHEYLFRGKRVRGFKEWSLKLVRRGRVGVDRGELVDFRFVADGRTPYLDAVLVEDNAKERSLRFWVRKHRRFAERAAAEEVLRRAGRLRWTTAAAARGSHDERIVWLKGAWYRLPLFVRPFLYFFYRYVVRGGFRDGLSGTLFHVLQALWYRLLVDARILRLRRDLRSGRLTLDQLEGSMR